MNEIEDFTRKLRFRRALFLVFAATMLAAGIFHAPEAHGIPVGSIESVCQ